MNVSRWTLPFVAILAATLYGLEWTLDSKAIAIALKMTPALAMALHLLILKRLIAWPMIAALALHAAGDAFLDLGKPFLLAGIGAFFLGHFGYIAAFLPHRRRWSELGIGTKVTIIAVILTMTTLNLVIWPKMPGILAIAAPIYAAVLTTMTITALLGKWNGPWVTLGALLFIFSDVLIGLRMFQGEKTLAFLIWPTYAAAQVMIPVGWLNTVLEGE